MFSQELKFQDQGDRKGRQIAKNQRTCHVYVSWSTSLPVRSKPCLTGESHSCTWSVCLLPLSTAEDVLSWVWVSGGDGQLATDATCQVPVGQAPGPQLR
ncbi:unnamed protein product [Gulo gulo]|uniref:Uncharacterized protein n=1 Tax=Gulo gulo TaxID=48420 RepID=A0A9X9LP45_GULGU|nr:unnamed protein product [Gulo gulo]